MAPLMGAQATYGIHFVSDPSHTTVASFRLPPPQVGFSEPTTFILHGYLVASLDF